MFWVETGSTLNYRETNGGKCGLFIKSDAILKEVPEDLSGFICGESIICVNESADTFFERYLSVADAIEFLQYTEKSVFRGEGYEVSEPFADFSLLINEEIDEMGAEYLCWPENWENYVSYGKSGATVQYDGKIYRNIHSNGDNSEFPPPFAENYWEECSFSYYKGEAISVSSDFEFIRVATSGGIITIFATAENKGDIYSINNAEYISDGKLWVELKKYSYTESRLKTLKRQKESIDDDGNMLDFVFNVDNIRCELVYTTGIPYNNVYNEKISAYTYDVINKIICTKNNGDIQDVLNLTSSDVGTKGKIYFRYIIGNMLTGDTEAEIYSDETAGGVVCEETYNYSIKNKHFRLNGYDYALPYIDIDYSTGEVPNNAEPNKLYAKIYITNTGENLIDLNSLIRYDTMVGIERSEFNVSEIKVDRGASASYEAFNVLGEINSLDDIENYHDDWFRIKGKND